MCFGLGPGLISHPAEEQNAAGTIVTDQEDKWVISVESGYGQEPHNRPAPHERHHRFSVGAMEKGDLIVSGINHRQWPRELCQP